MKPYQCRVVQILNKFIVIEKGLDDYDCPPQLLDTNC